MHRVMQTNSPSQAGACSNEREKHLLFNAVLKEDMEQVQKLLEAGACVNAQEEVGSWAPLHAAVQNCREDLVSLLLEHGADPLLKKRNGATPFIIAGIMGHVGLLELFLSKGAQVDECDHNGFTALMEAAMYGHEAAVRFLHARGAEVNLRQPVGKEQVRLRKGGATALMRAAESGHPEVVKALLELGAEVDIRDNCGRNALIYALRNSREKSAEAVVRLLLAHGVDVRVRCERHKTPLMLALEQRHEDVARLLLEQEQLDVDATDRELSTALQVAVQLGLNDAAQRLCLRGANTDCGDLVMMARRNYNRALVQLLRQHGARDHLQAPATPWKVQSPRWGRALMHLQETYRPMLGRLKIFIDPEYKVADTSEGGVYLGFYEGQEVAVKRFHEGSEPGQKELACLQMHLQQGHLLTLYGYEKHSGCLFVCLALCECNLEEQLLQGAQAASRSEKSSQEGDFAQSVCSSLFEAVDKLHRNGYAHQDLQPRNVLIDSKSAVWLADFDKSTDKAGDEEIKADLKALGLLVLYVAQKGDISWEKLKAKSEEEGKKLCPDEETQDLLQCLFCPGDKAQGLLPELLGHPFFWSSEQRYRALRDVGNESDIKTQNSKSKLVQILNTDPVGHSRDFAQWTSKIDKYIMKEMNAFYKRKRGYQNNVTDLLKFIRNIGEHINEDKNKYMKSIMGEPSQYFQEKFPSLFLYVYQRLKNTDYAHHIQKNSPARLHGHGMERTVGSQVECGELS